MSPGESPSETPRPPLNQRAVLCVVLGVVAFVLLLVEPFLSLVLAIPSVTTAVSARGEVMKSRGGQRGFDLAGTGLAIGSATLLLAVVAVFIDLL